MRNLPFATDVVMQYHDGELNSPQGVLSMKSAGESGDPNQISAYSLGKYMPFLHAVEIADCLMPGTARIAGISVSHTTKVQYVGHGLHIVHGLQGGLPTIGPTFVPTPARIARLDS
jgi:hypothetical protein